MIKQSVLAIAVVATVAVGAATRQGAVPEARVDAVLSRWDGTTPGCAVGVSLQGKNVLEKAYGMADLELRSGIRVQAVHGRRHPLAGA